MTVPDAAAWIGVPYGTPMSIPSCIRPPHGDRVRLRGHAGARPLRSRARGGHLRLGRGDLVRDLAILLADLLQVLELVEQVGEARRGEDDGDRVRVVGLVDRDEARVEAPHGLAVLPA